MDANRRQYDADIKERATKMIDSFRPAVFLGPRQLDGMRFNDTSYVLAVLESETSQAEFEKWPLMQIKAALQKTASADYWYSKEKDYGNEVEAADEDIDEGNSLDY